MSEERREAAANTIGYCERMYAETQNPYYVVMALDASHWGSFKPSEWALKSLLDAVHIAATRHHLKGDRISIDAALGFTVKRGKKTSETRAHKTDVEVSAFELVRTIHACFDISIPDACEIVYYAIDFNFARSMEEVLWRPRPPVPTLPTGMTRAQWDAIGAKQQEASRQIVASPHYTDAVRDKLTAYKWWEITRGDQLGYSLDQFIDRYYRSGSKRRIPHGKLPESEMLLFEGNFLLLDRERCTHAITLADCEGYRPRSVSAVANLPRRPNFARFVERLDRAMS